MKEKKVSHSKHYPLRTALILASLGLAAQAAATELVYFPLNPSFGGSPLNGQVLLNSAQATNRHTDPDAGVDDLIAPKTPLQMFNESLERSILNRLTVAASSKIIGADGQFVPGILETENFTITVADLGGGLLNITTTDKVTGDSTSFQVNQ
ncbi:curli assembly protein CsgF [Parapusillimonas sp. SGNA-6]|nr:curli assembly protein CsgF [Parapusillimonas sp. SGNA-6]